MELQETRRYILDILKQHGDCTVDEIVQALSQRLERPITTVTVRHHLERLRAEGLVNAPEIRRRNSPGRPQYVYSLSAKATDYFPNNYAGFAESLLAQIKQQLPQGAVNTILEGMAEDLAYNAGIPRSASLELRLTRTVDYLNEQGYLASYEAAEGGFVLSTTNCPYERVACNHAEVCQFDLRLISSLLGVVPRFLGSLRGGDEACQYFIPQQNSPATEV